MKSSKWAGRQMPMDISKVDALVNNIIAGAQYDRDTGFIIGFNDIYTIEQLGPTGKVIVSPIHMRVGTHESGMTGGVYPDGSIYIYYNDFEELAKAGLVSGKYGTVLRDEDLQAVAKFRFDFIKNLIVHELTHALDPALYKIINFDKSTAYKPQNSNISLTVPEQYRKKALELLLASQNISSSEFSDLQFNDQDLYQSLVDESEHIANTINEIDKRLLSLKLTRNKLKSLPATNKTKLQISEWLSEAANLAGLPSLELSQFQKDIDVYLKPSDDDDLFDILKNGPYLVKPEEVKAFFSTIANELKTVLLSSKEPLPLFEAMKHLPTLRRYINLSRVKSNITKKILQKMYSSLYQWMVENGYDPKTGKKIK